MEGREEGGISRQLNRNPGGGEEKEPWKDGKRGLKSTVKSTPQAVWRHGNQQGHRLKPELRTRDSARFVEVCRPAFMRSSSKVGHRRKAEEMPNFGTHSPLPPL